MLDMSWGEVMLIGGVALIVIGPKDLPKALRTVGQVTTKLRRMAGEFQMQFNEAIREAELDEVRKDVDGIRNTVRNAGTGFNPVQTIRDELKGAVEARAPKSAAPKSAAPSSETLAAATAGLRAAEAEGAEAPLARAAGSYDVPREASHEALPVPGSADDPYGTPEPAAPPVSQYPGPPPAPSRDAGR